MSDLRVKIDAAITGKDAAQITQELDAGTPRIKVNAQGKEALVINAYTLNAGEEYIIANALRHILA